MEYPKLKYIDNSKDVLEYTEEGVKCDCCGKTTNFYTDLIYSKQDVEAICVDCVTSGNASKKFDGNFNEAENIEDKMAMEEVELKTPTLPTYQEFLWPACCNDMCVYLRKCTEKDLENKELMLDVQSNFKDDNIPFEDIKKMSPSFLRLFKCAHCGKHKILVDLD